MFNLEDNCIVLRNMVDMDEIMNDTQMLAGGGVWCVLQCLLTVSRHADDECTTMYSYDL